MMNPQFIFDSSDEFIVVAEEQERNYWTERLGVSIETLKSAIRACRSSALQTVSDYLNASGKLAI